MTKGSIALDKASISLISILSPELLYTADICIVLKPIPATIVVESNLVLIMISS